MVIGSGIPWKESSARMKSARKSGEELSTLIALALQAYPRLTALVSRKSGQIDVGFLRETLFVDETINDN